MPKRPLSPTRTMIRCSRRTRDVVRQISKRRGLTAAKVLEALVDDFEQQPLFQKRRILDRAGKPAPDAD